jgi:hypothetical protein
MADIFQLVGTVPAEFRFEKRPGSLRQISVGNRLTVWGINDASDVFEFNRDTGVFEPRSQTVPGGKLELVSAAQGGGVWGINASSDVFQLDLDTKLFQQVPGLKLRIIRAGGTGGAWGINADSDVFTLENLTFQKIDDIKLNIISVGPHCNPWGINADSDVFRWHVELDQPVFLPVPGQKLTSIAVGDDAPFDTPPFAEVWGLNVRPPNGVITLHDIFHFDPDFTTTPTSGLFFQKAGELLMIAASVDAGVWGINAFHDVFFFNGVADQFQPVPGQQLDAIAVGSDDVWGLSTFVPPPH